MNSVALHQAIYTRLAGFTALTSQVVGVYSKVPQPDQAEDDAAFPFVTIGPHTRRPFDTDDDDGQQVTAAIHVWDRFTSELSRAAVRDAVYDALHKYDLPISGADTLDCLFINEGGFEDPDGKTFHSILQFRVTYTGI